MKRLLVAVTLLIVTSWAMALPSPNDISAAVNAGQLTEAETMLRQVVAEKPNSAKAHYELGQVLAREGRKIEALDELKTAQRLDSSLNFASSPERFIELQTKLTSSAKPPSTGISRPAVNSSSPTTLPQSTSSFPWGYVLIGGAAFMLATYIARRRVASSTPFQNGNTPALATERNTGQSTEQGGYWGGNQPQPRNGGAGIGGAVLGGVAGLAAGYGLSRLLDGATSTDGSRSSGESQRFTPIDNPPQENFGSFDAGSGDSWDGDTGASSGDDNW